MDTQNNKAKLETEKKLLEEELGGLGQVNEKSGDWEATPATQIAPEADENDQADRAEGFEERSSTLNVLEKRLEEVNKALSSIEEGTYGVCELCGNAIEEDRINVNPAASTCKACMEKVS